MTHGCLLMTFITCLWSDSRLIKGWHKVLSIQPLYIYVEIKNNTRLGKQQCYVANRLMTYIQQSCDTGCDSMSNTFILSVIMCCSHSLLLFTIPWLFDQTIGHPFTKQTIRARGSYFKRGMKNIIWNNDIWSVLCCDQFRGYQKSTSDRKGAANSPSHAYLSD